MISVTRSQQSKLVDRETEWIYLSNFRGHLKDILVFKFSSICIKRTGGSWFFYKVIKGLLSFSMLFMYNFAILLHCNWRSNHALIFTHFHTSIAVYIYFFFGKPNLSYEENFLLFQAVQRYIKNYERGFPIANHTRMVYAMVRRQDGGSQLLLSCIFLSFLHFPLFTSFCLSLSFVFFVGIILDIYKIFGERITGGITSSSVPGP